MKRLVWWRNWYMLKFRKIYETKMHKHHGNLEKLKLFLTALGEEGWQIVYIEPGEDRFNGGPLTKFHIVIVQREHHIGARQLFDVFKISKKKMKHLEF